MTLTTSSPTPVLRLSSITLFYIQSFLFLSLSFRKDSRLDSSRVEGSGVLWGLCLVAKESSELILSFPMCLLLPPFFTASFPIYHLTIISIRNFHSCCVLHCRHSRLNCVFCHHISRTSYV